MHNHLIIVFQVFNPLMFGISPSSQQQSVGQSTATQTAIDIEHTTDQSSLLQAKTSTSSLSSKRGDRLTSGERITFSQLPPEYSDGQQLNNKHRREIEKAQLQLFVALCKVMNTVYIKIFQQELNERALVYTPIIL